MAPASKSAPTEKQVVDFIKKGLSIPKAAAIAGVAPSVMAGLYYRYEPVADPSLKITGQPAQVAKAIVAARNNDGLRWERIAARTGKSVNEVKEIFEATSKTSASDSYTGRGRRFNGSAPATKKTSTKASDTGKGKKTTSQPAGKARTRAARAAKSGTPS